MYPQNPIKMDYERAIFGSVMVERIKNSERARLMHLCNDEHATELLLQISDNTGYCRDCQEWVEIPFGL